MTTYREGVVVLLEGTVGRIALQQRDDIPYWGLFGGWLEHDETPPQAVIREIHEELCCILDASKLNYLGLHIGEDVKSHVFHYLVEDELQEAKLTEGLAFQYVPWTHLQQWNLIPRHLEILKMFWEQTA